MKVFDRIDIMHYVHDVPIVFFSNHFIDNELIFARCDPQLMNKVKSTQKEIETLRKIIYHPDIY